MPPNVGTASALTVRYFRTTLPKNEMTATWTIKPPADYEKRKREIAEWKRSVGWKQ